MVNDLFTTAQQNSKLLLRCKYCNEEFVRTGNSQKFCSKKCALINVRRLIEHPIKNCLICNKEFQIKTLNQKYCSYKCKNKKHNSRRLKGKFGYLVAYRNKIRKCEVCGFSLFEALESHHYSKTEGIVLCGNCHNIWHAISKQKYSDRDFLIKNIQDKIFNYQYTQNDAK